METVDVREAKARLSDLLKRVGASEEIMIAKAGKPVARLVPAGKSVRPRVLGSQKGCFQVPKDFDTPLPGEVFSSFEP